MKITHIVFDLGGVLVELDGQPVKNEWLTQHQQFEKSWQVWLNSPLVLDFDRGKITPNDFAEQIIAELELKTTPEEFLNWITHWPKDFFPGALDLLLSLKTQYSVGIFSNITSLHWPRYLTVLKQHNAVTHYFASYQMGLAKPEKKAFEFVIHSLRTAPQSILFLDDNIINVESARRCGINAYCVKGINQTRTLLEQLNLS